MIDRPPSLSLVNGGQSPYTSALLTKRDIAMRDGKTVRQIDSLMASGKLRFIKLGCGPQADVRFDNGDGVGAPPGDDAEMITKGEVASRLKLSIRTVTSMVQQGLISPALRLGNGKRARLRFCWSEVKAQLKHKGGDWKPTVKNNDGKAGPV